MANIPITFLATGVGFGYAPAGPAHEPTEDIAYMRSLCGIEIHSPVNNSMVKAICNLTYNNPKLRYIRLERSYDESLDSLYIHADENFINNGMCILNKGEKSCIISSGYMLNRALKLKDLLKHKKNIDIGIIDLWRIKPIISEKFYQTLKEYSHIITIEEQTLSGGFGSAICEMSCDLNLSQKILRLGLPEKYIFENGTRDEILDMCGLSIENMYNKIEKFI